MNKKGKFDHPRPSYGILLLVTLLWGEITVKFFDNQFCHESKLLNMPVVGSLEVKVAVEAVVAWIEDILAAVDILFQDQ